MKLKDLEVGQKIIDNEHEFIVVEQNEYETVMKSIESGKLIRSNNMIELI